MQTQRLLGLLLVLALLVTLNRAVITSASDESSPEGPATTQPADGQAQQAIIIDHTCTDLSKIPDYWIEQAKEQLRLSYGHTSHGSQPVSGMGVLRDDPSYGGLYDFNTSGAIVSGTLSLDDYTPSGDLGHYGDTSWADRTRTYLNSPGTGSSRNVVVWSWCAGVSDNTPAGIDAYLAAMDQLETEYPDVTFVYMTGHLDGTGVSGDLNVNNNQIRDYCIANNKVLFDFADIESYDPDGNYYLDLAANDYCSYDSDGNGTRESNWANEWCAAHPGECSSCSCAHSRPLNCDLKAGAFWWMLARLAGWDGGVAEEGESHKGASIGAPVNGQTVTYTIVVRDFTTTTQLTDRVPTGLSYLPGTLTATMGTITETDAPTLRWSGNLSATPAVTVTYAVTVSTTTTTPQFITNTAFIVAPDQQPIAASARIIVNGYTVYLPLVMKNR